MCKAKNARLLETKDWVKVRARVEYEYMPEYEAKGPMLYADYVEKAGSRLRRDAVLRFATKAVLERKVCPGVWKTPGF